ncbi:MAG TPA: alanine--glyoxylate aminotransferase family protein [Acidimicrobiales bacterium]|nr:alanine--glyoxylate aminotransferase family protein [Acidimicrobiales bacterium]
MPTPERLLMGPGPSNPYPEVVEALTRPVLGHLDPAFLAVLDATMARLRTVFGTDNALTLPLSGTGSAGMEAAFVNVVRPGDPVVVGVNGLFGERMCEVAARCGAEVVRVEAPWGEPLDPAALLGAHPAPAVIALVHAETSTGVVNDVAPLGEGKGDALLVVDAVTSLAGMEVAVDRWGVDIAYSGTQKCLGVPPGLAPITLSPRARARLVERPSSWYLDLNLLARYVEDQGGGGRVYHHTAPVTMIAALHAGLGAVLDEGLDAVYARHAECGALLQDGLEKLGLRLFAAEGHRLAQLTTVVVPESLPDGLDEAGCRRLLLERFGIEIGGGAGTLAGRVWRIGCMGHSARRRNVGALLGALGEVLGR